MTRVSRTSIYRILEESHGEVEHAMVCGRRLINLKSLSAYLSRLSKQQAGKNVPAPGHSSQPGQSIVLTVKD
jgi:hypothetical protein